MTIKTAKATAQADESGTPRYPGRKLPVQYALAEHDDKTVWQKPF